jgi:hypothetical protein
LAYCREIVDLSTVSLGMKILVSEVHLARLDGGSKPSVEVFWQGKGKGCSWLVEAQPNRGLPLLGGREGFLKRASSIRQEISCSRKSSCAKPKWGSPSGISNPFKGISWRRTGCSSRLTGTILDTGVSLSGGFHEGTGVIRRASCLCSSKLSKNGTLLREPSC